MISRFVLQIIIIQTCMQDEIKEKYNFDLGDDTEPPWYFIVDELPVLLVFCSFLVFFLVCAREGVGWNGEK